MEIYNTLINGIKNPIGFSYSSLLISWKIKNAKGKRATWSKIELSLSESFDSIIYSKEGVLDNKSTSLDFTPNYLTRYYLRISVKSDKNECAISNVFFFETALPSFSGNWIGVKKDFTHPVFKKDFTLSKDIKRGRLYITGLGLFEAYINNKKVGEELLTPLLNDYESAIQYFTYDITSILKENNEIRVILGDGWWRGHFGLGEPTHYERPLGLKAKIKIEYNSGEIKEIDTDESWKYSKSFITLSDIYNGETDDYTLIPNEWEKAEYIPSPGTLTPRYSPYLHYQETIGVKEVIHTPKGETVLDFGQNFAGHVVFTGKVEKGKTVKLEFGEILQEGNFYHDNYRHAESVFTYISDGEYREVRPHFTFFGFRYVKVSGIEDISSLTFEGRAIYSEMEETGFIETGNKKINRLFLNTKWGLKSNFLDIPTDCPQRDERLAWCGDAAVFAPTAGLHMDTRAFYHKFLKDLREDQKRNNGAVAIYLPNSFTGLSAGIWSDCATIIPKMLYDYYGSKEELKENLPLMKDWVDYVYNQDVKRGKKNLYDFGFQFGDWLSLDGPTEQSKLGRTDTGYICSLYYYASTLSVRDALWALGDNEEGERYNQRALEIKEAILNEYFTPTGRLSVDTQTGFIAALKWGVYRDKNKIIEGYKKRFKEDLKKIKSGFAGATMILGVLAENNMENIAFDLLFNEDYPGWLYEVNLGATTIWERWNSVLEDGRLSGTEMNSLNHYSYGAVSEFLYKNVGGITPLSPGFDSFLIKPLLDNRFGYLKAHYESIHGPIVSEWRIEKDGSLSFHIEVPFGTEAKVELPEKEPMVLSSGIYDYHYKTQRDYLELYDESTPLKILFKDNRVLEIINRYLPSLYETIDKSDEEEMNKGLIDLKRKAMLFRTPYGAYDNIISDIKKVRN